MEWQEVSVRTVYEALEAVSDLFYELGSGGVVIEDPQLLRNMSQSGLWDTFELPAEMFNKHLPVVKGYLPINENLKSKLEELKYGLQEITNRLENASWDISLLTLAEEDWAHSWKAYFKPSKVGNKIVIKPSWETFTPQEGELILELDPGMAFGTGNHATTSMCVKLLEKYLQPGMEVIDVGTGTGILAMSAATLGAEKVLALDFDEVAVRVARENTIRNGLEKKIILAQNDLLHGRTEKVQLVVANIIADVIIRLLPQVETRLDPKGYFIASGIISERKNDVCEAALKLGFSLVEEKEEDDWVAQVWQIKGC